MTNIAANELKTKGVSVLNAAFESDDEAIITVRGKQKYVVLKLDEYNKLREYELEAALIEAQNDIASGNFQTGDVTAHIKRVID
ncbi:type II toxin-antitoxin system Phd/YefM family antitoxin [Psychromonas antarctica]|uniref:type II toxin-antitoxin system Phd/YefM family antitoxin n=1 Tax=Psychromonas antarctica TaxID=67573 RepID=UPI001EE91B73|nr:type II toxin-antitoxin system Phd/YefM family antitoxin [Psychromonas antarctica]MCG6201840.1 type II toxin-antitoxin system Phd/YefM family antitoxin [Psychromonas antarctica]